MSLSELHIPSMITAIHDSSERARLTEAYSRWIHQAKSDLVNVMISASNVTKRASQKQFNDTLTEIWNDQHRLPEHERLSTGMLRLIDQRKTNIADCFQSIYIFKAQFSLHVPSSFTGTT